MPLARDIAKQDELAVPTLVSFTTMRQQARASNPVDQLHVQRSTTPQIGDGNKACSQNHRSTQNGDNVHNWQRSHSTDDKERDRGSSRDNRLSAIKLSVPSSLPPKPGPQARSVTAPKPQRPHTSIKPQDSARSATNVFDETTSLDSTFFDTNGVEDNQTMQFRPQERRDTEAKKTGNAQYTTIFSPLVDYDSVENNGPVLSDNWRQEVAEEREFQKHKPGIHPLWDGSQSHHFDRLVRMQASEDLSNRMSSMGEPETPSRTQSVPPLQPQMHAPIPKRQVEFVEDPQFYSDSLHSPNVRSADMAREQSPGAPPRPKSAQPTPQNTFKDEKHHSSRPSSSSPLRQGHVALRSHPTRFQKVSSDHYDKKMQQGKDAHTSDLENGLSSDDDGGGPQTNLVKRTNPFDREDPTSMIGKKRSFDESNALDYSPEALKTKTLSSLQNESYMTDPRDPPRQSPLDTHGDPMTLPQVLSNMSNMTPEVQRSILLGQTDEEWAQTGQWFIDKFQADLKELMQVRLERRKVALKYENKIKQRQKEIEHHQAGVKKELQALQDGGSGLLKDRKPAGSSQSSTPLRTGR